MIKDHCVFKSDPHKNQTEPIIQMMLALEQLDGILINLEYKPTWKGENFYSRKSCYCISATIICDAENIIRYCHTVWPECFYDACIFANTHMTRNPGQYFSGDQYVLGNSAYAPSHIIIPAYKKPQNGLISVENKKFNYKHDNT
ncbi:hypothetical protein PHYBLDRAFT_72835 [Phycomyces blakesleeanus NRRL 1555(-)]|uniref:DDE Tnp4 domain-containing protein n=1 Tax=Phycomyces blakesleeanus (strain ATCC 8743b / DSM 1359 / FGSC 10004 / NBRC 33097 / NRRL 1555) TaxID=763407 RepID=A0A162UEU8_PHYB8|nr:hypothetical protein PHYBLDRAFT_72835 [Phycomyces blakesleeanus NRRL 1555(-)]OAD75722.1 hypothetical protein PHYBLDRAFT_72835 [Phycomyces blakesleeanus NRRL 1555(-)]|eukprot:XP_018293762.1 hypothetical protein PHYBLDRAFT_72835 [Phycomyces blakesleeanus NRRL 1555(-)]